MLDRFVATYIRTALWSSTDDDGKPLDENFSVDDIDPEGLETITNDCMRFLALALHLIDGDIKRSAHDFWLTRNRHGAGFWDGDWNGHEKELTEISRGFGECNLYVGDDGKIYVYVG